jgi:hypothetical protein
MVLLFRCSAVADTLGLPTAIRRELEKNKNKEDLSEKPF